MEGRKKVSEISGYPCARGLQFTISSSENATFEVKNKIKL